MERRPRWSAAERVTRETSFPLEAGAAEIFPLLCPVREYDWIPDWRCTMIYSESGVAERDAVFHTRELLGMRTVWTCVTYEPPRLIEYVFVVGKSGVVRLSIRLDELPGGRTQITWTMRFTVAKRLSRLASRVTSQLGFDAMPATRRRQLEEYLARR